MGSLTIIFIRSSMKLFLSCFFLQLCQGGNVPRQGRIITFPQSQDDTLDVLQSSPSVLARQNTPEASALIKQSRDEEFVVAEIFEPPAGQRCAGRNFQDRRCCTPENPCDEGEGDCDGPGDGGQHDEHRGCKGDLVCGSNNCKKFGHYYHEKDDCCERPSNPPPPRGPRPTGWGPWSEWGQCSSSCGPGWSVRTRQCVGSRCGTAGFHTQEQQEKVCIAQECNTIL